MTDKEIYERWYNVDVLTTYDEKGKKINLSEEEGTKLALLLEEAFNLTETFNEEDKKKYLGVFPLLIRLYNKKDFTVKTLLDKYISWMNSETYKKIGLEMFPIDSEYLLNKLFLEHYDDIDNIINGTIKFTWL